MFYNIDVTHMALDASLMRYNQLTTNVANIDTVGYKRSDVAFQSFLAQEIAYNGVNNINFANIEPIVYQDKANVRLRFDESNIDIDVEMAELSKEKTRYDTLIQRAQSQIGRYTYIFQNIQ